MAARCELRVENGARARDAAMLAIGEIQRIEAKFSRYRRDSALSEINRRASSSKVACDAETSALLHFANEMYGLSNGLFDITSGVLRKAWNFNDRQIPCHLILDPLLDLVGWEMVELENRTVHFKKEGMEIDFGGIGKEYAADRARKVLLENHVNRALIDLGGDIATIGTKPDGSTWMVGVRDPRVEDRLIAVLPLTTGALATSGDYERFFEHQGQRYCHILNPRNGYPCSYWQSVSITDASCLRAGTLATIAMLKQDQAPSFLRAHRVAWLGIDPDGKIVRS